MSYYYDPKNWSFSPTPPGIKVPLVAVLVGMPLIGALFVVFLPVIGFWVTGHAIIKRSGEWLAKKALERHSKTV